MRPVRIIVAEQASRRSNPDRQDGLGVTLTALQVDTSTVSSLWTKIVSANKKVSETALTGRLPRSGASDRHAGIHRS